MEGETYQTYLDYSLGILKKLLDDLTENFSHLKSPVQNTILDLKFLELPIEDGLEVFCEGLIFLLSFIVNPPEEDIFVRELISTQICAIINELPSLISSIHSEKMEDQGLSEAKPFAFLQKIDRVKTEVSHRYVKTQHSPQLNFSRIYAVGFLDTLLRNLDKMLKGEVNLFPLMKHRAELVHKELIWLRPFLVNIMESGNEVKELKNLSTRMINMIYSADYVIKLCPFIDVPIWHSIIWFYDVVQEIELVKLEVNKASNKNLTPEIKPIDISLSQATTSEIGRAFIGFEKDVESIVNHLTRGQKCLTIISISGLPGQGKTTLAKRIYHDPRIQFRFGKIVWCYVSKECVFEKLLIYIIHNVCETDVKQTKIQDLVEHLRKSLKGKRYLIVMDDIWDVEAWRQIELAFPDDHNESRILFTSRNDNLASQAKSNSISHHLPLFTVEESWELIKEEVFFNNVCPPEFLGIGKQIARDCNGLPLAAALIASLLRRMQKKLDLWREIAKNIKSHLTIEGCMNIIELSYKYLPDNLKPCFLYFGAFRRGENVCAKKLKLLWIAERFIMDSEMKCSRDLANEYLDYIISQNLVMVTEKSSKGGIKTCMVHDLLYDLCMGKAKEENILLWVDNSVIFDQCHFEVQKYFHNRLCIGKMHTSNQSGQICSRKELATSWVQSFLWFYDSYCPSWEYESIFWLVKSFEVLTVLDLDGVFLNCDKSLEVILSLIHLRYLALKVHGSIIGISPSIANLWNLETVIIGASKLEDPLPIFMWMVKSLRHVDLPCARLPLEIFEENNSFSAYNIERLGTLILKYDNNTMEFLQNLSKLRKLVCFLENNDHDPKWIFKNGSLTHLESLKITGCDIKFSDPNQKCQIFNFLKFENLTKLTLSNLRLPWSDMSTIGKHLPNLQVLKLNASSCKGSMWNLKDVCFSKLRYLKLSNLNIEQIDDCDCEENPFPCLEQLMVLHCYKLKGIPSIFGDICTLMIIMLDQFTQSLRASAEQILKYQQDMGNGQLQLYFFTPMLRIPISRIMAKLIEEMKNIVPSTSPANFRDKDF